MDAALKVCNNNNILDNSGYYCSLVDEALWDLDGEVVSAEFDRFALCADAWSWRWCELQTK